MTFMTEGGDTVINMALHMAPASEHLPDWFHITMRLTVMKKYVKGLAHHNPDASDALSRQPRQKRGFRWHGNLHDGQAVIEDLAIDLYDNETDYASIKALRKFVESTVNTMVGKRFGKRQQMRWSKQGAHLMLQTRSRTLDGTLRGKFEQWYPGMKTNSETIMAA